MAIRLLDQHTAELIAAGEVVERPASVVKELVENAIDAGATNIQVEIEGGGIRLIRIQDNGGGIEADEIPLAFLRHATSKVRTKEDLDSISTLGFRGEALASIASVAKVELVTKTDTAEFASLYRIEGGQEAGLEPAARPLGTTLTIRSLFYNTPARMKFLKKDASEGTFVTETVTRLALSNPGISFRYLRDGKLVFLTPGDGKLETVVYAVLGNSFAKGLLPAEGTERQYHVHGLISKPEDARASRSMQFFFINGRFVKNRTMMAALEQAYRGMTMQGKFPGCVLFMEMPHENVDVNVHPAKTEVRFARESDVFDAVYKAVKSALLENKGNHPQLTFSAKETEMQENGQLHKAETERPATVKEGPAGQFNASLVQPQYSVDKSRIKSYNELVETLASDGSQVPYEAKPRPLVSEYGLSIEPEAEPSQYREFRAASPVPERGLDADAGGSEREEPALLLVEDFVTVEATEQGCGVDAENPVQNSLPEPPMQTQLKDPEAEACSLRFIGEVFQTYIIAEKGNSMCLIDKHAAHERLLFEQFSAQAERGDVQQLLSPVTVTLSAAEKNALLQNLQALAQAGIELEDFGGNGVLVRGIPANMDLGNVENLVVDAASRMALNPKDTMTEKTEWVLHSVACRAAVKAGDKSHGVELLRLAEEIMNGTVPPFCPHGRPVVLEITNKELEKQFGRLG